LKGDSLVQPSHLMQEHAQIYHQILHFEIIQ
jgi:hypothetical protein